MKKLLVILFFPLLCFAQKQGNIWYFSNHAGLDFSSGTPVVLSNGQTYSPDGSYIEGSSVISDSSGALLFYTNGTQVWNKMQQVMPHGDSLLGSFSSTQSSIIVPLPGSSRYFYVFTTDAFYLDHLKYGFRYTVVDMCLDGGKGDVLIAQKNILLLDTVSEKLTAVRHNNGTDYWIITHKFYSDAFYAYQLTAGGVLPPVVSHIGSRHPTGSGQGSAIGELKASPNGSKLCIVNGQDSVDIAEYFDFNTTTGVISNCVSIQPNPNYCYYGVSFSPDNSKLYLACWLNANGIYQYNLNAGSPSAVIASRTQVATSNFNYFGLQLANNGKIYFTRSGTQNYMGVINNPNNTGAACNYQDSAIYLPGQVSDGLPNFIDSYQYTNAAYTCPTAVNELDELSKISLAPNPFTDHIKIALSGHSSAGLKIFDVRGALIRSAMVENNTFIRTEDLAAGFYTFHITEARTGRLIATGKLIKE